MATYLPTLKLIVQVIVFGTIAFFGHKEIKCDIDKVCHHCSGLLGMFILTMMTSENNHCPV